jgi:hypothetical protein
MVEARETTYTTLHLFRLAFLPVPRGFVFGRQANVDVYVADTVWPKDWQIHLGGSSVCTEEGVLKFQAEPSPSHRFAPIG